MHLREGHLLVHCLQDGEDELRIGTRETAGLDTPLVEFWVQAFAEWATGEVFSDVP